MIATSMTSPMAGFSLAFEVAPFRLSGLVVGALLNHAPAVAALDNAVNRPPHKAPPSAPVLAIKPRNTLASHGATVKVPHGTAALEIGASLGIVIGRTTCRVARADALRQVAGYVIVNDVSVPITSHYRPSVRFKARDGFCVFGPQVVAAGSVSAPDALAVRVSVNGERVHSTDTSNRVRAVAQLIADVSDFMTLQPGDVLMLGVSAGAPLACAGDSVVIGIDGLGELKCRLMAEGDGA